MPINWKTVTTSLFIAAVMALAGAMYDFQNIKAEVKSNAKQSDMQYQLLRNDLQEVKRDVKLLLRRR